ncbi:MAG TPA: membrane dipeptidase [Candidatus Sumerlaeota bacterium]|nr:membrane dipeptidase [Candidatus Sumerlaeota bacterium]HOR26529.1 membrane dipeptidase [Candidatus Sumerlaeota bacterium]
MPSRLRGCLACLRKLAGLISPSGENGRGALRAPSSLPPPPNDYNFIHPPDIICGDQEADPDWRYPLSPEEEQRAMEIYRRSMVIVSHTHCVERSDFDEMQRAGITAAVVKLDIDLFNMINGQCSYGLPGEDWFARGTRAFQRINQMEAEPGSNILIVRDASDLHRAKREGKVGLILGFEGALALNGELKNLRHFYDLGLRELQPWFLVPNQTMVPKPSGQDLSDFGEALIKEMNRMGVVLDLELMQGQGFARAIRLAKEPVYVSHTAVADLDGKQKHDSPYPFDADQMNDATIRAVAERGGPMGLHFLYPNYIRPRHGTERATLTDLMDHMTYIRDLVGIDHVALGVDFFPATGYTLIEGAGRIAQFPNVARAMVRHGFSDEEISRVLGGNMQRIFEAHLN